VNFLAHFHLAWPDKGLVTGGLDGDYVKGPLRGDLPPELERGIRLHRAVDAYTDAHPLIQQLRKELHPRLRRYGGILIDLSFDHFLSLHWSRFSSIPLTEFNNGVYHILNSHEYPLSQGGRKMAERLIEYDILNLYTEWTTVTATATRIGQRFKRHNPFLNIDQELSPSRNNLEQVFLAFYPQLELFSAQQAQVL
jgi:acyl carrier protein phosphodiesterase